MTRPSITETAGWAPTKDHQLFPEPAIAHTYLQMLRSHLLAEVEPKILRQTRNKPSQWKKAQMGNPAQPRNGVPLSQR